MVRQFTWHVDVCDSWQFLTHVDRLCQLSLETNVVCQLTHQLEQAAPVDHEVVGLVRREELEACRGTWARVTIGRLRHLPLKHLAEA